MTSRPHAKYEVKAIRKLCRAKLGSHNVTRFGWTYEDKPIAHINFGPADLARYIGSDGTVLAVFQGNMFLND